MNLTPSTIRAGFYRTVAPDVLLPVLTKIVGATSRAGVWQIPFDQADRLVKEAQARKVPCTFDPGMSRVTLSSNAQKLFSTGLYPHQIRGVQRGLELKRVMLNFKPGLGKSAAALHILQQAGASRILIACPAIVRDTWAEQFELWWPKAAHEVQILETGKQAWESKSPIQVVSYELLDQIQPYDWHAVILDESHYVKTAEATRSKSAARILSSISKDAYRLFLTGTPIANEPIDLHNQVNLLWPGLFGELYDFRRAYCQSRDNPHAMSGKEWFGLNPKRAGELSERLSYLSVQATEKEVEGLLPPVNFQVVRVRPSRAFNLREYLDNFDRRDLHASKGAGAAIRACGVEKVDRVIELVEDALLGGSTHISIMTHLKDTAEELARACQRFGVGVACIHGGNSSQKKRHGEITRLAGLPKAIFVGTMHSVSTGINELVAFPDVVYAELDYRPDEVVQSMKRYPRLNSKSSVRIRAVILEGTLEEKIAKIVARKLKDQKMLADIGTLGDKLHDGLDAKLSDEEFFVRVQEAAAKMRERDVYA